MSRLDTMLLFGRELIHGAGRVNASDNERLHYECSLGRFIVIAAKFRPHDSRLLLNAEEMMQDGFRRHAVLLGMLAELQYFA